MGCCYSSNKIHDEAHIIQVKPKETHWSYDHIDAWSLHYPDANGKHQSPIDINTSAAIYEENLAKNPIVLNYDQDCFKEIKNNGHTFVVSGSSSISTVSGATISNPYRFAQFHMHWGSKDSVGSEHLIDGVAFSAELHFVYWNFVKYASFNEAVASNKHDGLLVLGVLVSNGQENTEFAKLIYSLKNIKLTDQSTELTVILDLKKLFPENLDKYWAYLGSLTTPPCSECVKWIVFSEPIQASSAQLNEFRNLHTCNSESDCCDKTKMKDNFRKPCKLNDRKVMKSFNDAKY